MNEFLNKKIIVILGPTATGKTDIALKLAKELNGELVACDSRQVYKGLDIGTGKLPGKYRKISKENGFWVIDGIKVWMYDNVDLNINYTVADYIKDSKSIISEIIKNGKTPITVGGTGFYLKALLEGLSNLSVPVNKELREKLEKYSLEQLQNELKNLSNSRWEQLNSSDKKNPRRLLRSIELIIMNPYTKPQLNLRGIANDYKILKIGLTAPRLELYKKVDLRILAWFDQEIVDEVRDLIKKGVKKEKFNQLGLEYSLIADFINEEKFSVEELIEKIKGKLHGYVRRQLTWYKKEKEVVWFDITKPDYLIQLQKKVKRWYD